MPFRIRKKLIAALFCFPLLIVGCSNSDSDPEAPTKIGVFIDAPVKGLGYSNTPSGIMGVTNEKGEYSFKEGDKVTFFIKGISIGQVDATPETPVTNLAKSTIVARILQSLDTESNNPDLIDISKISIPAEIQQDLSNIIASSENARALDTQLTSALSPENLKIIEDASIVDSGDEEIDLVDTLVTESAALDHINAAGILVDFTAADLVGQAFFLEDDEGEFSTIYFLDGVAYKFDHPASEQGQATKDEVSWVIDGGKLIMTATIGDTTEVDTVTLRSIDGNRYLTSVVESDDPNSIFAVTFNKVQLLTPASLGSKILKRLDSSSCNERTIEFSDDGTTGTVKSLCGDDSEYRESTISVSSVPELENVIAFSGEDGDGPFTAHLSLIDGTFEVGSQLRFSLTSDKNSVDNIDAKVDMYEVVTEAVQAPVVPSGGFALEDISRQVYTRSSGAVIVAFFENNTGTETNSGTESSEDKYATDFTWAIDNGFLLLDYPGDADDVSVELTGVSGDIHSVIVTEVDGAVNGTIYKSKALSPADLNNKILALTDPSENVNCAERTIKFSTQDGVLKADMRERCGGEYFASPGFIVTADSNLDNVVKLNLPDSDGVAYITLVSGDLSTPATVTLGSIFYKSENDLEAVEIESYSLVENELVAPIVGPAFDASNIARQVYLDVDKQEMMVFENESIGALYENVDSGTNGDTNGVKHPFTWSVVEGTLNVDFTDESIKDISATLESVEGNVYQVKVISHDGQPVIELKRAMPLAVSDLDGLIIADSSNVSCPGSISITGLSAVRKEVCISEGNDYHEFNMDLSQVPEFDNVIKFTINDSDSENANEVYFTLVGGSIANEVMTFAAIFDPNETEVGEVEVFDYIVTDQEVQQPEPTGEVPTVVGVPVFLQNGSSASITVKFSEDMQDTYNTSGSYVPTNSYWSDSRTFVVEFSSFTPGQTITFNTDGFETVGGKEIAQPYVFTFPETITTTTTTTNADTGVVTTTTNNSDGSSVIVTTTPNADGSSTIVTRTINSDGITEGVITSIVNADGSVTTGPITAPAPTNPDNGTTVTTSTNSSTGATVTTTTNADGSSVVVSITPNPEGSSTVVTSIVNADGSLGDVATTTILEGDLESIVGSSKTFYQHVADAGQDGTYTFEFDAGTWTVKDLSGAVDGTGSYAIDGNVATMTGGDESFTIILIDSTDTYIVVTSNAGTETTRLYFDQSEALNGPIDAGDVAFLIEDGISNTSIRFENTNGEAIAVPSDAYVRIIPNSFTNQNVYKYQINCSIQADGSFENACLADIGDQETLSAAMSNPSELYQVLIFKNHIDSSKTNWECGENLYKYVGSSVSDWSNITVKPIDFQDRIGEQCD